MRGYLLFISLLFIISCSDSERELRNDELIKAKWKPLFNGVDYISTEKADGKSIYDSLTIKFKGYDAKAINGREIDLGQFEHGSNSIVRDLLKNVLKESGAGYLRISLGTFFNFSSNPRIYLKSMDSLKYSFSADSVFLLHIPGIRKVKFISKDEAKKIYLADGDQDWSDILDDNPLPDAIEIMLEYREWTKESMEKLKLEVLQKITAASDFVYPSLYELDENLRVHYYYVYKRN